MLKVTALFLLLAAGACAGPITWTLQGITFADGGTASGSFVFDATADAFSSIDITTVTGPQITGATYLFLDPANIPFDGPTELFVVTSNGNVSGTPVLSLFWSPGLTNAGGTGNFATNLNSAEGMCTNATCSTVDQTPSSYRIITAGSVTTGAAAVPEPATFVLVGGALGILGWKRRCLQSIVCRGKTNSSLDSSTRPPERLASPSDVPLQAMASPVACDPQISAADVLQQLERILSHEKLAGSPRLSRFLRFIVQSVLDGNAESLKEYSIGTNVFDRRADFDPRTDPIVRVQATNLRIKLADYYSGPGLQDLVSISVPKGGYAATFTRHGQSSVDVDVAIADHTIAVLPFVNVSSDPENEYFSDGLTGEIITNLAAVPQLGVVARTSVFRFKGQRQDLRELGRQLHASTILEGSVRKSGQQLRITAQLIDTKTGLHLWSESWQRELGDTFAVQEEIAAAVAKALLPQLVPPASRRRTPKAQAHDLYLRGRFEQNRLAEGSGSLALALFEQAIEADPLYARAHAGLAGYLHHLALWGIARPHDVMPKAKAAALRALELDDQLADAHITLGSIQCGYDYDWKQGRQSIERGLKLDGDSASSYEALAMYVMIPQGSLSGATTALHQAIESDPFREIPRFMLVACYSALGDFAAADENHRANPAPTPYASLVMASAYEENGELDRAISELSKVAALCPGTYGTSVEFCRMYTKKGWPERAQAEFEVLMELVRTRYVPATEVAMAHLGMGNLAQGIVWLERAVEERTARLWHIPSDIRYRAIRKHPAFHDILRRIGLQPVEVR